VHEITRPQLAVYAAAAIAIALLGARYVRESGSVGEPASARPANSGVRVERDAAASAIVHVAGAVRRPGVFRFASGARVQDAVRRAGGPTSRGDLNGLNLAARIADGQQIVVPRRGTTGAAGGAGGPPGAAAASPGSASGQPVSLNSASLEQLQTLQGVGPAIAQAIVAYRQRHGGFRALAELDRVPGIGAKRLAALRPLLQL
jgi:competence protein ComEA